MLSSLPNSSPTEVQEFTISASLKLVDVCLGYFTFRDGIDLICLAIKLLFSSIHQWHSGTIDSQTDDKEHKADERESLKKNCVHQVSKKVGSKLNTELDFQMTDYYKSDALLREFEVLII